jgi:Zn-finger nucleic acid-binding protein
MNCPNDHFEMQQVKIESHYGQPIILEQCKKCGGIWFDESELFRAKHGEAEKIELMDNEILRTPSIIEKAVLTCPRDNSELMRFDDRYFPEGIILLRCTSCKGIWLNRGDFTRFQRIRKEMQDAIKISKDNEKIKEEIEKILSVHKDGGRSETLENIGRFLSTPIDRTTLRPLENTEYQTEVENTVNIALNVLTLILRAFILI